MLKKVKATFQNKELMAKVRKVVQYMITICLYVAFLADKSLYTVTKKGVTYYAKKKLIFVTVVFLAIMLIIYWKNRFSDRVNKIIACIWMVISPFAAFAGTRYITNASLKEHAVLETMKPYSMWLNILIFSLILLICLVLTNSIKAGTCIMAALVTVFAVANYFVYQFRGIPIMASDIATIGTAMNVADEYTFEFTYQMYIVVFLLFGFIVAMCKLKNTRIGGWKLRTGLTIVTVAACALFMNKIVWSTQLEEHGVMIRMFRPMDSYRKYGCGVTFVRSIQYSTVNEPDGYSLEAVHAITDKYKSGANTTEEPKVKPNIISIVNETFSDISVLGDFQTSEEVLPFFNSLKKNTIRGWSYASIVGGQTANTEFEYLTENSMAFLPGQAVAFQMYVNHPMESLARYMDASGYQGVNAFHPFYGNNYNRPKVYPNLGFKNFITRDDMDTKDYHRIRTYISDDSDVDRVIKEYENAKSKSDDPYFLYNLTIQNHSPYDQDFDNFKTPITLDAAHADPEAQRYLNLVHYSDQALEKLVKYFEKQSEPTVIVFFGDHQPRLTNNFLSLVTNDQFKSWNNEQMMQRYKVPFIIWANYDIEEKQIEATSMNFIQTILLDSLGYKLTGFQQFLLDFQKQVPVLTANGYYGADGKFYEVEDKDSPYYEWIHKYEILQYNNIFDKKNTVNEFFELK